MTRFILKSMLAALTASLVALPLQARDTIQIVGSSTVYPFATVVAEKLGKKTGKTPVIESTGTGGGMKLFCAGLDFPLTNISSKPIRNGLGKQHSRREKYFLDQDSLY